MSNIAKILKFEFDKLRYDKLRLFFLITIFLMIIGFAFMFCYLNISASNSAVRIYNTDVEANYIKSRDENYSIYLDCLKQAELAEDQYTYSHLISVAKWFYKEYQYCNFIVNTKSFDFYRGYSVINSFFDCVSHKSGFLLPLSGKIFGYQDIVYILIPVILSFNTYFVFVNDKVSQFNKNYGFFNIQRRDLLFGKMFFALIFDFLLIFIFSLIGLVYTNGDQYLLYNGDYHLYPTMLIYYLRWMEIFIYAISIDCVLIFFCLLIKNKYLYFSLMFPLSFFLIFIISGIKQSFSGGGVKPIFINVTYYNFLTSDSFLDGRILFRIYGPLIIFALFALYLFYDLSLKQTIEKMKKRLE